MVAESGNVATVGGVAVKAPPFYRKSPEAWFRQMESQFALAAVTKSDTKFHHVLAALPEDIVSNIDLDTPAEYEWLKEKIIKSLRANKHQLIEELCPQLSMAT